MRRHVLPWAPPVQLYCSWCFEWLYALGGDCMAWPGAFLGHGLSRIVLQSGCQRLTTSHWLFSYHLGHNRHTGNNLDLYNHLSKQGH